MQKSLDFLQVSGQGVHVESIKAKLREENNQAHEGNCQARTRLIDTLI